MAGERCRAFATHVRTFLGTNKVARVFFFGKRVTSLFNSFCSNAAKLVAPFFVARYTIPLEERLP